MKQPRCQILGAIAGAVLLALPMSAMANTAPETHKPAASAKAVRSAWPPETLAGTIMTVNAGHNLVIVKGPGSVPFDMRVTRRTRILSGNKPATLASLVPDKNDPVSVRFTPERSGDIASRIEVQK
jgi:hypothetical protein